MDVVDLVFRDAQVIAEGFVFGLGLAQLGLGHHRDVLEILKAVDVVGVDARLLRRDLGQNTYMLDRFFVVGPDMRGRGSNGAKNWWGTPDPAFDGKEGPTSDGTPDSNGYELNLT